MTTEPLLDAEVPVAEAIVRVLIDAGIDMVFGMPGGRTLRIYDALFDHRDEIRSVLVREESLAGIMAEVYGRLTGRPGVSIGQGIWMLANGAHGILEAHTGASPVVVLSDVGDAAPFAQHAPYQSGSGDYGTWDLRQVFTGFTKMTAVPTDPVQAVQQTQLAVKHALAGEPGPAAVFLADSAVLGRRVGPDSRPRLFATRGYLREEPRPADPGTVARALALVAGATRPVLVAGGGVRVGQARAQLARVAEALDLPVATTAGGKGVFPEDHPLSLGLAGTYGVPAANAGLGAADLVLAVGTRLASGDTADGNPALIDPTRQVVVHLDVEERNAGWTVPADVRLLGDARVVLGQLADGAPARTGDAAAWVADLVARHGGYEAPESSSDALPMLPQRVLSILSEALPDDAVVTADAGENRLFMNRFFRTRGRMEFLQSSAIGCMGYALPAAMAAKLVHPDRPVVAVCGDGGLGMAMPGLFTAVEEDIPVVVVVLDNSSLGWVSHIQRERSISSRLGSFDYAAIAAAAGWHGERAGTPQELRDGLGRALAAGRPALLQVAVSDEVSWHQARAKLPRP